MSSLGWRTWSNDPPDEKLGLVVGGVTFVVGALLMANGLAHLSSQPWDLAERGVETIGVAAERDPLTGDRYRIEVDGKRHVCHRGEEKLGQPRTAVLYDPADPSRCRAKDTASRAGRYESMFWPISLPSMLMGISLVLARLAEPREPWARTDPPALLRPKLMWAARGLLALTLLSAVIGVAVVGGAI